MATIKRCDRCSSDFNMDKASQNISPMTISIPVADKYTRNRSGYEFEANEKKYDLCLDCIVQLNEWVKPLPKGEKI